MLLEDSPGEERVPSLYSLDQEQRVIRFDSFSKVLSAGMRLGWVSGPSCLLDFVNLHMQASSLHTSNISQLLAYGLLSQWGEEGLERHITEVQRFYRHKRDTFVALAEKHLEGLAEWSIPTAGMFLWINLLGVPDSKKLIEEHARDRKVCSSVASRSPVPCPLNSNSPPRVYFRVLFSHSP